MKQRYIIEVDSVLTVKNTVLGIKNAILTIDKVQLEDIKIVLNNTLEDMRVEAGIIDDF